MGTESRDLGTAFGERVRRLTTLLELCAVVGCYAVDYDEADVEALYCHWHLIAEDVLLGFEVMNMSALYPSERRLLRCW